MRSNDAHDSQTLDLVRGSRIINVSLGARRVMTLRTKKSGGAAGAERRTQRIGMPHNSVFVLGSKSNREWLHGIRADKRPECEKEADELAFGGVRISLTFRQIGTFQNTRQQSIWGSGARSKTKKEAHKVSTDANEVEKMLEAFGSENRETDFDWHHDYGTGFDAIDLIKRDAELVLSDDALANLRARLALSYKCIPFNLVDTETEVLRPNTEFVFHPWAHGLSNLENPVFKTAEGEIVEGDLAILFYLEKHHAVKNVVGFTNAQLFQCAAQSNELLYLWREYIANPPSTPTHRFVLESPAKVEDSLLEEVRCILEQWEDYFHEQTLSFVAGEVWTVLDCAFWPVLHCIIAQWTDYPLGQFPALDRYHESGLPRKASAKAGLPLPA